MTEEGSQLSMPSDSLDGERRSLAAAILGTEEAKDSMVLNQSVDYMIGKIVTEEDC